ncbi:MAG: hypothetical protein QGG36_26875, partial [Pirellulaceae bacterium]|nr:hypothetical protein [Pirellulaceae bacterium]
MERLGVPVDGAVERGDASLERGRAGRRENGTLDAAATPGSPVLKHGPLPPVADWGVNAPCLLERWRGATTCATVICAA